MAPCSCVTANPGAQIHCMKVQIIIGRLGGAGLMGERLCGRPRSALRPSRTSRHDDSRRDAELVTIAVLIRGTYRHLLTHNRFKSLRIYSELGAGDHRARAATRPGTCKARRAPSLNTSHHSISAPKRVQLSPRAAPRCRCRGRPPRLSPPPLHGFRRARGLVMGAGPPISCIRFNRQRPQRVAPSASSMSGFPVHERCIENVFKRYLIAFYIIRARA